MRAMVLALTLLVAWPNGSHAYQTYAVPVANRMVPVAWSTLPIRYYVTDRGVSGVTSTQFRDTIARAFAAWQAVPSASVSTSFVGFTTATPGEDDGQNTLGFQSRPDLERVLGSTSFLVDDTTGTIVEADIFFNAAFAWSVSSAGESGKFDLESIAVHEIGHLFGLGHSAIGETELLAGGGRRVVAAEAAMFPIAFAAGSTTGRTLRADDVAGISALYPVGALAATSGTISGRVTKAGSGVLGAHVLAFHPSSGALVGGFTVDANGAFQVSSLAPGPYILRVEPVDDADLESYFDSSVIPLVDVNFRVAFFEQFAVVPVGGLSSAVEIKVVAK
jgi:hypothetical protein